MKIGVDIDEVVVEFFKKYLKLFNKRFGKNLIFEDIVKYEIWDLTDVSQEETLRVLDEFGSSESFFRIQLVKGAKEVLDEFFKSHEIFFITSRPEKAKEQTWKFFEERFQNSPFKIIFSGDMFGGNKTKFEICKELGIPILIEDRRKYALDCAQNGIRVLLMDKPWNQNCEHENLVRVKSWKEIMEKIGEMKSELENKEKNIVDEVRKFVEEECKKNNLGEEILINHIILVVEYAKELSEKLNADVEIVEISAWLHDIGSIICGRENHHLTGAEIAEKKLKELNYPDEKIEKVKKCILNHRGSIGNNLESVEEQILVEADCLPCFDHLEGQFLWVIERDGIKNQQEIRKIIRQKFINKYNQISLEGKKLIKPKYDAVMLLLGD